MNAAPFIFVCRVVGTGCCGDGVVRAIIKVVGDVLHDCFLNLEK